MSGIEILFKGDKIKKFITVGVNLQISPSVIVNSQITKILSNASFLQNEALLWNNIIEVFSR